MSRTWPLTIWPLYMTLRLGNKPCFNFPICWGKNKAKQIVQQASVTCLAQFSVQRIEKTTWEQTFLKSTQTTREDLLQNVKKETEFSTEQQSINLQNKVDLPNGEEQLTERLHWEDRFIFWGGLFCLKKGQLQSGSWCDQKSDKELWLKWGNYSTAC